MQSGISQMQKTRNVTHEIRKRGRSTIRYLDEVDDDEYLPQVRGPPMKRARSGSIQRAGCQQIAPAVSQAGSGPATPKNAHMPFLTGQNTNIQRISNPSASFAPNAAPANVYNTPALRFPSGPRSTGGSKSRHTMDLTHILDERPVRLKQEIADTDVPEPKSGTYAAAPVVDNEDEEDLKDELREIQIRGKLRAMEKKKLMAGRMVA